jgi:hypothetical protein
MVSFCRLGLTDLSRIKYYNHLADMPNIKELGKHMTEEEVRYLNEDQKKQLNRLKEDLTPKESKSSAK